MGNDRRRQPELMLGVLIGSGPAESVMRPVLAILVLFVLISAASAQHKASISSHSNSPAQLVAEFKGEPVFWKQFEIARRIAAAGDRDVLPMLEPWLSHEDRHIRANVAYIFGEFGDDRGLRTLEGILNDFSARPIAQGIPTVKGGMPAQIEADRYYAVHVLGDLKDRRAVPVLIPLLHHRQLAYIAPWALGQIGDRSAIPALISATADENADVRVLAIYALKSLNAKEALPRLRELLNDNEHIRFDGLGTVSQAAQEAIAELTRQ
jgi:HEAT repeat protein